MKQSWSLWSLALTPSWLIRRPNALQMKRISLPRTELPTPTLETRRRMVEVAVEVVVVAIQVLNLRLKIPKKVGVATVRRMESTLGSLQH